jgi:hypothetical protein
MAALAMGAASVIGLLPGTAVAAPKEQPAKATVATEVDLQPLGIHTCDPGDFCAYYLRNLTSYLYAWAGSDANWSNNYLPTAVSINNNDMSWWNRGNPCVGCDIVRVFDNPGYGAPMTLCVGRGSQVFVYTPAENRGSSHSWYGSC